MNLPFSSMRLCILSAFLLLGQGILGNTPCQLRALQCEYLVNPLGIDAPSPRFTWQLADARQGAKQKAYQVLVSTDSLAYWSKKYRPNLSELSRQGFAGFY